MAVSVHLALREAVLAAREANGLSGNCRLECPATPERIRMSCAGPIVDRVNRIAVFTELMHAYIILQVVSNRFDCVSFSVSVSKKKRRRFKCRSDRDFFFLYKCSKLKDIIFCFIVVICKPTKLVLKSSCCVFCWFDFEKFACSIYIYII